MLRKWTGLVLRYRYGVLIAWFGLIIVGALGAHDLNTRLTTSLVVPGSDSSRADQILMNNFGENNEGTFTLLYRFGSASPQEIEGYKTALRSAVSTISSASISQEKVIAGYLAANISTSYPLVDASTFTEKLRGTLQRVGLSGAMITGPPAIYHDVKPVLSHDLLRGETVAIVIALVLLLLLLGTSWTIFIPLIVALANISLALGALDLIARRYVMVLYIPNIVELIGLGLAIDYSLLMLHRFHREHRESTGMAVQEVMQTAGRTVVISGSTVAVGMIALLLVPVPFIQSLGTAGAIVPLAATLSATTLQPALLSFIRHRRKSRHPLLAGVLGETDRLSALFERVGRWVVRRAKRVLAVSLTFLALISMAMLFLEITPSSLTKIPTSLESSRALDEASSRVGSGIITPHLIVIDLGSSGRTSNEDVKASEEKLSKSLSRDPESFITASGLTRSYVDPTGRYLRLYVVGRHELGSAQAQNFVNRIRNKYLPEASFPHPARAFISGAQSQGSDMIAAIKNSLPKIAALLFLTIFILLKRAFKSVVLPLKAILLDLTSITFACGSIVLAFKFGLAHFLFGSYQLPRIEAWVLLFLFALLFGLSMDYEVFIVSRIREAWISGMNLEDAITDGLSKTGGVVSAAALILIGALSGLSFGSFAGLQELGIGLMIGILVDATIIRFFVLPATMALFGRWNWWNPQFKTPPHKEVKRGMN